MIDTIFFDRDGVINDVVMRDGLVSSPRMLEEFSLRPDFVDAFKKLEGLNLNCYVVSNQPDVRRNLMSEDALAAMTAMIDQFQFKEVVYCKHDNDDNCLCRKPKPGMLTYLIEKYGIDRSKALFIGDSEKDVLAGASAGVKTVFLQHGYSKCSGCQPDLIVDSLQEFVSLLQHI